MNSASENFMLHRFGEGLDADVLGEAAEALQTCDLFMTIGTSSVVYPAAGFAAQVNLLLTFAECSAIQTAQDLVCKTACHYLQQTTVNALRDRYTATMRQTSE
jgi:NAD-dependent SIR2 family protein deacetylase